MQTCDSEPKVFAITDIIGAIAKTWILYEHSMLLSIDVNFMILMVV